MSSPVCRVDLGRRDYQAVWDLQRALVARRQEGRIPDVLLLVEHPPTYTIGRGGRLEHLLAGEPELERAGACLVRTDRGGDVTYHGPGQLVGYPIVDLKGMKPDVHWYLRQLEELLIRTLSRFGIEAGREPDLTGVWHRQGKLAAIGVRVSRWVASHGFALNVSTDLASFQRIVPCGIVGRDVASMESILRGPIPLAPVADAVAAEFGHLFDRTLLVATEQALYQGTHDEVG